MIRLGLKVDDLDLFDYCDVLYSLVVDLGEGARATSALDKMLSKPLWPDEETWGTDSDAQDDMSAMMALGNGAQPAGAADD